MRYIAVYRANHIPRICEHSQRKFEIESLVAQTALWNAAQILVAQTTGLTVETRIVSGQRGVQQGESTTWLMLLIGMPVEIQESSEHHRSIHAIERLLPREYGWIKLDPTRKDQLQPAGADGDGWQISRVVRRVEFASLPRLVPALWQGFSATKQITDSGNAETGGGAEATTSTVNQLPFFGLIESKTDGRSRRFPRIQSRSIWRELRGRHALCLPLVSAIATSNGTPRRLFQELEHSAPVVVSMAIHPIDSEGLKRDRWIATGWRRFLEPFAASISNTGFAQFEQLLAAFDRYGLPDKFLSNITIRVAARVAAHSVGVAQHLCSRMGGMRSFEVLSPKQEKGSSIDQIANPVVDVPSTSWPLEKVINARAFWQAKCAEGDVVTPKEEYLDFLCRFPHMYSVEEVERVLALPFSDEEGLTRTESVMVPPFSNPSMRYDPVVSPSGELAPPKMARVRIGMIPTQPVVSERLGWKEPNNFHWHSIELDDLTKHALVVGSTGSGKTLTTLSMLGEIARNKIPFLVIEPVKTEYFARIRESDSSVQRFNFDGEDGFMHPDFLPFDPMRLQDGVTVARHVSYLKSCFEAAFPMEPFLSLILENGIRSYYTSPSDVGGCGLSLFDLGGIDAHSIRDERDIYPSLTTFARFFCGFGISSNVSFVDRAFPDKSEKAAEFVSMFKRRFENLLGGVLGEASRKADTFFGANLEDFELFTQTFSRNTVIELDAIPDPEQKSLTMAFLLTFLFEKRQAEGLHAIKTGRAGKTVLRHFIVIEEAHRLLTSAGGRSNEYSGQDSKAKAVSLFVDMLAEIRSFGQGLAIVEQIPTKIATEVVKNTNLKIMLRLTSKDDRDYLGAAMNFNEEQKKFVTGLRANEETGIQFVVFDESVDQPILLTLPLAGIPSVH